MSEKNIDNIIEFDPDWTSCPGDTIADFMEKKFMSFDEFSAEIGLPKKDTQKLLLGFLGLDDRIAGELERLFGAPKQFWINREINFRRQLRRLHERKEKELQDIHDDLILVYKTLQEIGRHKKATGGLLALLKSHFYENDSLYEVESIADQTEIEETNPDIHDWIMQVKSV